MLTLSITGNSEPKNTIIGLHRHRINQTTQELTFSTTDSNGPMCTSVALQHHRKQWPLGYKCWLALSNATVNHRIQVQIFSITGSNEPNDTAVYVLSVNTSFELVFSDFRCYVFEIFFGVTCTELLKTLLFSI